MRRNQKKQLRSASVTPQNVYVLLLCLNIIGLAVLVDGRKVSFRLEVYDLQRELLQSERDPFKFTQVPSMMPSLVPTSSPSDYPSRTPTVSPTNVPSVTPTTTQNPTSSPSSRPTSSPTSSPSSRPTSSPTPQPTLEPTSRPSSSPTSDTYGDGVRVGGPGYFNYNPDDLEYGPKAWGSVHSTPEFFSWAKWPKDVWGFELNNQCNRNWRPSPIDVCDGVGDGTNLTQSAGMNNVNTPCHEYHRILTDGGDWRIDDDSRIKKLILPSKLRLEYTLRDCPYQDGFGVKAGGSPVWFPLPPSKGGKHKWCDWEPPAADYPNHWNGHIQPIHIDIKFPSEHTICGRRYEGEFVVWHIHPQRQAAVTMSTLIEVGQHNSEMQKAIDEWTRKYRADRRSCRRFRNRKLREENSLVKRMKNFLRTGIDHENVSVFDDDAVSFGNDEVQYDSMSTWMDLPVDADKHIDEEEYEEERKRKLQGSRGGRVHFNPYHPLIYRSVWFYGYWGTMTEPPCSDRFISWRIMDAPMEVSQKQLDTMKTILFTYTSPQCTQTSAHHKGSVARPTQPFNKRGLWRCNRDRWERNFQPWRCNGHEGTQYGCKREPQTAISPPPTFAPTSTS